MQIDFRVDGKPATQHGAITGTSPQWEDQRRRLQTAYPDGIETLVINAEGSKEPPCRNRHILVGDVVDLEIVNFLLYLPAVGTTAVAPFEFALEFASGFD